MVNVGSELPTSYGGLNTTFRYKNFDLSILMKYATGHIFKDQLNYSTAAFGAFNNTSSNFANIRTHRIWDQRWRQPGDEATTNVPRILYNGVNPETGLAEGGSRANSNQSFYWTSSDINYHKADFLRVQEIIFGYSVPQQVLDKTFFKNLRATFQVTNPFLFTANDVNRDPEAVGAEAYTNLTRFTLGIRTTF